MEEGREKEKKRKEKGRGGFFLADWSRPLGEY